MTLPFARTSRAVIGLLGLLVACTDDPIGPGDGPQTFGSLIVNITTTGMTRDNDGYQFLVDGHPIGLLATDGEQRFDSIPIGKSELTIEGMSRNCRSTSGEKRTVDLIEGTVQALAWSVVCDSAWRNVVLVRRTDVDTAGCPHAVQAAAGRLSFAGMCSSHSYLIRMRADGSEQVLVADNVWGASVNAAGTLVMVEFGGTFGLYHVGTGELEVRPWNGAYEQFNAISPDGRRLTFTSDKSGEWQTYVRDLDGTNEVRVTHSGRQETAPSWSPNGTRLVLGRSTADYTETPIVTLSAAGGSEQVILPVGEKGAGAYGYSLDGERILYNSFSAGTNDIWSMDLDGTHRINHTGTDRLGFHNSGLFSPDRSKVMYDRGGNGLFVVDTAGGPPVQITYPTGIVFEAPVAWLP